MRAVVVFLFMSLSSSAFAADWHDIQGIYALTPEAYLDPPENGAKDTHFRFQLKGKSAKDLYTAMKVNPVKDDCTGASAKDIGNMQCVFFKDSSEYECHFSINIAKQMIEYGVAC